MKNVFAKYKAANKALTGTAKTSDSLHHHAVFIRRLARRWAAKRALLAHKTQEDRRALWGSSEENNSCWHNSLSARPMQ